MAMTRITGAACSHWSCYSNINLGLILVPLVFIVYNYCSWKKSLVTKMSRMKKHSHVDQVFPFLEAFINYKVKFNFMDIVEQNKENESLSSHKNNI
mmetsp:Transcript_25694/g.52618  ORF Transcript_25694/g.52618 Transcript_25694/m.52618 type:complete len:96 (-) Transcript_25694:677-964(-)